MTKFRPCIDLHDGKVKQIVGGTLTDDAAGPQENFVSSKSPAWFAECYCKHGLTGGHVIQLGPGNKEPARQALHQWRGGLQVGGGINLNNAGEWIDAGASHVIVTSWLFDENGKFSHSRLREISKSIGADRLVIDLSCRKTDDGWTVAMNRWQTLTDVKVTHDALDSLAEYCAEYLVHAADVEGLCGGVDADLCRHLGDWSGIPMTYAGGVANMDDVRLVEKESGGSIDITVGSALDIFGGTGVRFDELVDWNQRQL